MDTVKFIFGSLNVAEDKSDNTFMVLAKESETKIIKKKDFLFGEELSCDFIFTNYYIARVEEAKFLLLPVVIPNSKLEMDNLINKLSDEFVLTHMKAIDQIYEWINTKIIEINVIDTSNFAIYDLLLRIAFEFETIMQFDYHEGGIAKLHDLCFFVDGNRLGYNVYNAQPDAIVFAKEVYAGENLHKYVDKKWKRT